MFIKLLIFITHSFTHTCTRDDYNHSHNFWKQGQLHKEMLSSCPGGYRAFMLFWWLVNHSASSKPFGLGFLNRTTLPCKWANQLDDWFINQWPPYKLVKFIIWFSSQHITSMTSHLGCFRQPARVSSVKEQSHRSDACHPAYNKKSWVALKTTCSAN